MLVLPTVAHIPGAVWGRAVPDWGCIGGGTLVHKSGLWGVLL